MELSNANPSPAEGNKRVRKGTTNSLMSLRPRLLPLGWKPSHPAVAQGLREYLSECYNLTFPSGQFLCWDHDGNTLHLMQAEDGFYLTNFVQDFVMLVAEDLETFVENEEKDKFERIGPVLGYGGTYDRDAKDDIERLHLYNWIVPIKGREAEWEEETADLIWPE
ncbi:hypothetical protein BJ508DRAFT_329194 [Ascobolus immersus RN42]|uniref:Uncharacterized protein n=1 Tax=Ascobolus immersus RN42 TaxID=1160509 RepID=A0A3N4I2V1_ASCIM|nr:hypothetical protein BJ508DRAFT_329194 [Ascobolus immersus RN42]